VIIHKELAQQQNKSPNNNDLARKEKETGLNQSLNKYDGVSLLRTKLVRLTACLATAGKGSGSLERRVCLGINLGNLTINPNPMFGHSWELWMGI
jgi:hypothetical protein